jgi:hypothetical protein
MNKNYVADTEIMEDVCENERDSGHLLGGYKIAPETLARYAGTYEMPGRQVAVMVSGDQLIVKDSAYPRDQLFVAHSETEFLSSVSETSLVFSKDAAGTVTQFTRVGPGKNEKGVRR